jgi:Trk K+ transport system NAD-binding subunit
MAMNPQSATERDVVVLGGGPTGVELATELSDRGRRVAVFDDEAAVTRAHRRGLTAHESSLASAKPPVACAAETVVVATPSDARNLLLAAAAPHAFDADRVIALVNDPARQVAFDDAGIETVCVSRTVVRATTESLAVEDPTPADNVTESPAVEDPTPADNATETDERARLRE